MSDDPQNINAVESILAERDALHGWLVRIDQAGGSTPQAVRARVRVDYERRLEAVTDRLRDHADAITGRLAADRLEHDDLTARARISRDALAEAELRHAVGEFSSDRFEQERAQHTGDLETFELSLGAVAERITLLEDVEALVSRGPTDAPPTAPDQANAAAPASPLEEVAAAVEADSDAFLSIFEPVAEPGPTDDAESAVQPAATQPLQGALPERGPLSFTPRQDDSAARPAPVPPGVPPLGMPGADQKPRFVRPSPGRGSELAEADADAERDHASGAGEVERMDVGVVELAPDPVLPDPAVDAGPRTLRCGECGAMNRPLEWYCEKCGAELTTS